MNGRVVVITGATGNLGPTVARRCAEAGASVVLLGTNEERLRSLQEDLGFGSERVVWRVADLTSEDGAANVAADVAGLFGRVDVVLHLIGGYDGGTTVVDTPVDAVEAMLRPHLWATLRVAKAFVPRLTANGWGRLICVSSPTAADPPAKQLQYSVAKAAEEALILTLAREMRGSGVTANVIVVRQIGDRETAEPGKPASPRATTPEEIAAAMLYLCSDPGGTVNGARIALYG